MTWGKLSDDFGDDCWRLSDAAFRLHVEGLVWSNRKLLDLKIPKSDLNGRIFRRPEAVGELLDAGMWLDGGEDEVYVIQHHAQYQRLRKDVIAQQAVNAANGALGGSAPRKGGKRGKGTGAPREVWSDSPSDSVSGSLSDSASGSVSAPLSERDGPGRDGTGQEKTPKRTEQNPRAHARTREADWDWPEVQMPGNGKALPDFKPQCRTCGGALRTAAELNARACSAHLRGGARAAG